MLGVVALLGCVPADPSEAEIAVAAPIAEASPEPIRVSRPNEAPIRQTAKPSAQGDADTSGLSANQIEAMFAASFAQQRLLDDHQAVCLVMIRAEGGGWPRNSPALALAAVAKWTDLPVLRGSSCAFAGYDVYPVVIDSGARAMLYSIRIEKIARDGTVTFWGNAIYGNLGANGAEFVLKRHGHGWVANPTGVSAIS